MSLRPRSWSFDLDGIVVEVTVKSVKYLRVRVMPPRGDVRVSAPFGVSADEVRRFVRERRDWIVGAQRKVIAAAEVKRPLAEHSTAWLWGRRYRVRVDVGPWESACIVGEEICLVVADSSRAELLLDRLYRQELEPVVRALFERWQPRVGRSARLVRLRRMKTRWGSCSPSKANITLNLALAQFRPELLEYVVVHELVHLWEHGHGPGFYARMSSLLPDWRELRAELKDLQP